MKSGEEKKMLDEDVSVPSISCFIPRENRASGANLRCNSNGSRILYGLLSQTMSFNVMKITDTAPRGKGVSFFPLENYIGNIFAFVCAPCPYIITVRTKSFASKPPLSLSLPLGVRQRVTGLPR